VNQSPAVHQPADVGGHFKCIGTDDCRRSEAAVIVPKPIHGRPASQQRLFNEKVVARRVSFELEQADELRRSISSHRVKNKSGGVKQFPVSA
jgi:hypothetical protein